VNYRTIADGQNVTSAGKGSVADWFWLPSYAFPSDLRDLIGKDEVRFFTPGVNRRGISTPTGTISL
jgi:hypothetical protein